MFRNNGLLHYNVIIAAGQLSSVLSDVLFLRQYRLFFGLVSG